MIRLRRHAPPLRGACRVALDLALAGWIGLVNAASPAAAQGPGGDPTAAGAADARVSGAPAPAPLGEVPETIESERIALEHREATELLSYLRPLLSDRGAVDVDPDDLRVVLVRDRLSVIERLRQVIAGLDHPPGALEVEIQIVRAAPASEKPPKVAGRLSPAMIRQLHDLLRFESYYLLAKTQFSVREGEDVAYQIGDFGVSFRAGLAFEERVKLRGFRVVRDPGKTAIETQLLHSHLNPWLGRPMVLGLASDEGAGRALMIVVRCSRAE